MNEKRFQWLKKHYEDVETIAYVGMVFWWLPFVLASVTFKNDIVQCISVVMFFVHFISVLILFHDDRLWRWIQ